MLTESSNILGIAVRFDDLVANPADWQRLYIGPGATPSAVASRSERLGPDLLGSIVRGIRKEKSSFLANNAKALGHSLCFRSDAWFEPHDEADRLVAEWSAASADLRTAFPGCFEPVDAVTLLFCGRVAARMLPSALPTWQDPHCRKPDWQRSSKKAGRPRKASPSKPACRGVSRRKRGVGK